MRGQLLQEVWDTFSAKEKAQIEARYQQVRTEYLSVCPKPSQGAGKQADTTFTTEDERAKWKLIISKQL